jgi:alpha-beta hydrolase superfamily lysophospholipase
MDYQEERTMHMRHPWLVALAGALILSAFPGMAQERRRERGATQAPQQGGQQPPFWITPQQAHELEKNNALPITPFYDTKRLPKGKPGELIHFVEFADYHFPYTPALKPKDVAIKTVRFLYHSQSAGGQGVPASGVILIPYGKPPKDGWPVVVWAHGTSGVGRRCAPSLMKDLWYSWEGLLQWAMLGYAVVAPDYAGLGTNVPHQYLAAPAQAQDVINTVPAARQAVKQLGEKWVAIGHSQGGGAVLFVAEMQHAIKDPNYLGAISLAPVGDLEPVFEHINNSTNRGYAAFLAAGIKATFPEFKYGDFLTPEAAELMKVAETGGWFVTLATFAHKVPAGKVLKPDWKKNAHFQKFRALSLLGTKPAYRPVLLLHGLADEAIPTSTTDALDRRMQQQKTQVTYRKYPDLDHDPLVFGSFRDQLRWVQDRFDGK